MPVFTNIVILVHSFPSSSLGTTIAGWQPPATGRVRKAHFDRHRGRGETKLFMSCDSESARRRGLLVVDEKRG
jgi:hypothetical protein